MPSVVGAVSLNSISASGTARFGDTFYISPKIENKVTAGSGSFNTGDFIRVDNIKSVTKVNDADISDQNQAGNA